MCGINGVWSRAGEAIDPVAVARLRDTMRHRGPDGEGLWRRPDRGDVVLGHRRLAIVDLSDAGLQPMANEDGTVHVTFNGEIYNHAELRAQLEARGHRFRSRCDAEVLVHLYEEHGAAMVERLVGMFAFAIWDEPDESMLLARDRLGIKPLYWIDDGRRFAFASEIKGLLALLPRRELDPEALEQYLSFVTVAPPRTMFRDVFKLAPATTMRVRRSGDRQTATYWDPIGDRAAIDADGIDWEAELRFRLERSVRRRMMSDVPVGVLLSGGVDSSTNVALFSELADGPVQTFSIGFHGAEEFNELDWARRVSERFGTDHHEVKIDAEDLWGFLPELVFHQDEPIADPVCVPLHFVSRLARESGVTVVHVGEGADELLAGYPTYVTARAMMGGPWQRLRRLPGPLRTLVGSVGSAVVGRSPRHEIQAEALGRVGSEASELWWGGAVAFYERGLRALTTPALRAQVGERGPATLVRAIARDAERFGARSDLDRLIYQDLRLRLPELLLMRVDKLTMANSIEARVPFLDHELVELAMAMPDAQKIAGGVGKVALKRAVGDLLPHDLIWRPKQGFGAPVAQWFRGDLGTRLLAQLDGSAIHELGFLDRRRIGVLAAQHSSGRADRSFQLWSLLNLCVWFDQWIAGREQLAT
ncbi:MAG: asparagine synthase (glutamine-hydrolyzing) [Chloroflexi bacterium]|nr:asparagine synthase (glutamine-hydrolyzing) [Chloroflexota bacterium]